MHTPTKFSYSGKVFHYQEELRGLANELSQAGIEIIGHPAREAVLEAIKTAKQSLDLVQVKSYQFEFSHAAILQTILESLALDSQEEAQLLDYIRKKNRTGLLNSPRPERVNLMIFCRSCPICLVLANRF